MTNPIALFLVNFLIRLRNLVVHEFPVILGIALAAAAAVSATPALVPAAVLTALLRFFVSPAFAAAATKEKVLDPKVIAQVEQYLAVRDAVKAQAVEVAPAKAAPVADVPAVEAPFTPAT
jgi:hypothetical protein